MRSDLITNATIMVVDDNPANLGVLFAGLSLAGFTVLLAQDGESALHLTEKRQPDLVLMDIMMPGIDGFETCRSLKARPGMAEMPVIFMSALTDTVDKVAGFSAGGVDYITKPIHQEEVLARVNTHLMIGRQRKKMATLLDELAELNAAKDRFFSIISHDLRGSFTPLLGLSEMLVNTDMLTDASRHQKISASLYSAIQNTYALLENLLHWAKLQQGQITYNPENVDLAEIVNSTVLFSEAQATHKNISLKPEVLAGTQVFADLNMISTVIRNLTVNAIKFTNPGGQITISARVKDAFIEVAVADDGVGISPENCAKLFKIDGVQRTEGTAQEKGTGLGLILCAELVKKNGGAIRVESEPGNGSTFFFTLPVR